MKTSQAPAWTAGSVDEALSLRAAHPDATVVAGGTDLMVFIEAGVMDPAEVINLWGCPGLRGISRQDGGLRIGALTTWTDLVQHPDTPEALRDCARTVGAVQIQNRGTVGGNIVNASPAGDSLPLWLAGDASFVLASVRGERRVPAAEFWLGYKQLAMERDELLLAVILPAAHPADALYYRKVGTRLAQSISKVVLGGRLRVEDGVVTDARVALGSVAPTPLRLGRVETALVGKPIDPAAADRVGDDIAPIDDVRSTADYRNAVARNIVRTWLRAERKRLG